MTKLIEAELTYRIIGIIYEAFAEIGFGYQEKYYQRSFEEKLKKHRLPYQKELTHPITVEGKIIGRYFMDFLVMDKVVVEWKVANEFYPTHINQVLAYLKATNSPIGLLARVTPRGVKIKRLANTLHG